MVNNGCFMIIKSKDHLFQIRKTLFLKPLIINGIVMNCQLNSYKMNNDFFKYTNTARLNELIITWNKDDPYCEIGKNLNLLEKLFSQVKTKIQLNSFKMDSK